MKKSECKEFCYYEQSVKSPQYKPRQSWRFWYANLFGRYNTLWGWIVKKWQINNIRMLEKHGRSVFWKFRKRGKSPWFQNPSSSKINGNESDSSRLVRSAFTLSDSAVVYCSTAEYTYLLGEKYPGQDASARGGGFSLPHLKNTYSLKHRSRCTKGEFSMLKEMYGTNSKGKQ